MVLFVLNYWFRDFLCLQLLISLNCGVSEKQLMLLCCKFVLVRKATSLLTTADQKRNVVLHVRYFHKTKFFHPLKLTVCIVPKSRLLVRCVASSC